MQDGDQQWHPREVLRFVGNRPTSTGVAIVMTDQGEGYLKALGNPEGPHALASEWVGTYLADWLGLPTFDFAIIEVDEVAEIPLGRGGFAMAGPAFIARSEVGHEWSGGERDLANVANPDAIGGLIVLDTWIRNRDRHHPDPAVRNPHPGNVFLSNRGAPSKQFILKAMDHTHCFSDGGELSPEVAHIGMVKDDQIYGFFAAFRRFVTDQHVIPWIEKLKTCPERVAESAVRSIPNEWQVDAATRHALVQMIDERARYVTATLPTQLKQLQGPLWCGG